MRLSRLPYESCGWVCLSSVESAVRPTAGPHGHGRSRRPETNIHEPTTHTQQRAPHVASLSLQSGVSAHARGRAAELEPLLSQVKSASLSASSAAEVSDRHVFRFFRDLPRRPSRRSLLFNQAHQSGRASFSQLASRTSHRGWSHITRCWVCTSSHA